MRQPLIDIMLYLFISPLMNDRSASIKDPQTGLSDFFWGGRTPACSFGSSLASGIEVKAQAVAKVGRPGTSREQISSF